MANRLAVSGTHAIAELARRMSGGAKGHIRPLLTRIVMIVFCAMANVAPGAAQSQTDNLIVPGVRVGPVTLGMTDVDLYKMLGDPARTDVTSDGARIHYVYSSLDVGVDRDSHIVVAVETHDPSYATAEGIKFGSSSLALMVAKLGPQEAGSCGPPDLCEYTTSNGLHVGLDSRGCVRYLTIVKEGFGAY